ncbi:MAG: potassium channel protein [Candidatus Zixiibacteriota bacterium]
MASKELSLTRKFQIAIAGLVFLLVGGTLGFMLLERMGFIDSLYMTVITLSSVGFSEVKPLDTAGRIFVMALIFFGVVLVGFAAAVTGQWIVEGQFKELVTRRKMENALKKMTGHHIIAGYGRVGRQVALEFKRRGVEFVVLEKGGEAMRKLRDDGFLYVEGDATNEELLISAGIDKAKTLVSTLPEEALNVYLTLTARYMNPKLTIIARADFDDGEKKLIRAGANYVVVPHIIGGSRMAMAALQPNVVDFMQMTSSGEDGLMVEELKVPATSALCGQSLQGSNFKRQFGVTIIGVRKPNDRLLINPGPETLIEAGDVLVLIGAQPDLERISREVPV